MSYSYISGGSNTTTSSVATIAVTYSPTAGNFLRILVFCPSNGGVTMSDNNGGHNTYNQYVTNQGNTGTEIVNAFWVKNCLGGATTFSATFTAGAQSFCGIRIDEWSVVGGTAALSLIASTSAYDVGPGIGVGAITSGTINVNSVPAMVIGDCINCSGNTGLVAGAQFTNSVVHNFAGGGFGTGGVLGDELLTSTNAALNGLFTDATNGGANPYVAIIAAFAIPGAPSGFPVAWWA